MYEKKYLRLCKIHNFSWACSIVANYAYFSMSYILPGSLGLDSINFSFCTRFLEMFNLTQRNTSLNQQSLYKKINKTKKKYFLSKPAEKKFVMIRTFSSISTSLLIYESNLYYDGSQINIWYLVGESGYISGGSVHSGSSGFP